MKTVKVEKMNKAERIQCEEIISRYARSAVGGTLQTKFGTTVNVAEITKMARTLAKVFKDTMKKTLVANMVVNALKKSESRMVVSEFVKIFPNSGGDANVELTVMTIKVAGRQIAESFANQRK